MDRRTLLVGSVLGVTGALQGCSRSASRGPAAAPTPTATVPTGTASPTAAPAKAVTRWPLTGRPAPDPAALRHPAVAVKVPDNESEHPQAGLDMADIVFVELDGYRDASGWSGTRLMPVFHSRMPDDVAPVRSIRPVDVPLLGPVGAIVGNTGATGWVLAYVEEYPRLLDGSKSYMATRGTGAYSIDRSRVRTYRGVTYYDRAVVCHPTVLTQRATSFRQGPRQAYLPFASTAAEVSTLSDRPAKTVRVPWKAGHTYDMAYRYDAASGRYLRSMPWGPHVLADGTRVATDNVLVVQARQHYAKIHSGRGGPEPIHDIVDSRGDFLYAHGGRYVTGTWSKGAVDRPFRFTLDDGRPLAMAAGQTYVELARPDADVAVGG